MAIPDFQTIMRPLLNVLVDGQERPVRTIRDALAHEFNLTEAELQERLPSGRQLTFVNRVAWALAHMKIALLVESPRRGVYRITPRGQKVLEQTSETRRVDVRLLKEFEEYRNHRPPGDTSPTTTMDPGVEVATATPPERMLAAYRELRAAVAADVLERVQEQTPEFFEQVVLDVLQAMGYGGSREDAAERLGRSGDGGVDGVIREDTLGLDLIYVQAKHWSNTVGRPHIQQFVGALNGQRASKGVFITTSSFSRDATDYADSVNPRVILGTTVVRDHAVLGDRRPEPVARLLDARIAAIWKALPKVVFSTTLSEVQGNARLASGGLTQEIERLRAEAGEGDIANRVRAREGDEAQPAVTAALARRVAGGARVDADVADGADGAVAGAVKHRQLVFDLHCPGHRRATARS